MTLKSDAKFEEKLICCFKNDKNLVNFDPSTQKVSKICTLIGSYCAKYLIDCNGTRNHNHLVRKRTLNHLAKLVK